MTFGDWLKAKREELRMSGVELEKRSGVSRQYISNLERNLRSDFTNQLVKPSIEKVDALAKGLGVSVNEARQAAGYASAQLPAFLYQINFSAFDAADLAEIESFIRFKLNMRQVRGRETKTGVLATEIEVKRADELEGVKDLDNGIAFSLSSYEKPRKAK